MKKFVELIQRVHQERFSVVINKIITEKIPVAFFTLAPLEKAVDVIENLLKNGINITDLITGSSYPIPAAEQLAIKITPVEKISKLHPRPEYIWAFTTTEARFAAKYLTEYITLFPSLPNTDKIYETFMNHLTDLEEVYNSLIDEESKKTFRGWWLGNISQNFGEIVFCKNQHYITEGFIPKHGDIFIDVGACDGGTAAYFSEMGCKVYAFEMDKKITKQLNL